MYLSVQCSSLIFTCPIKIPLLVKTVVFTGDYIVHIWSVKCCNAISDFVITVSVTCFAEKPISERSKLPVWSDKQSFSFFRPNRSVITADHLLLRIQSRCSENGKADSPSSWMLCKNLDCFFFFILLKHPLQSPQKTDLHLPHCGIYYAKTPVVSKQLHVHPLPTRVNYISFFLDFISRLCGCAQPDWHSPLSFPTSGVGDSVCCCG